MHVIVRTKHEQRCRTSALRKRDGLVSRARALALKRRQDVVYMRRPLGTCATLYTGLCQHVVSLPSPDVYQQWSIGVIQPSF